MIQDVERLSGHIGRILDLARIESRSYGEEFAAAEPVSVTEQFLQTHAQLFRNCDIQIHNPSGQSFSCSINLPLFEMLLMNLLTNAIKYNSAERPRIDIRFEPQKRRLNIRFEDNGVGMEKGELKKIFRKFYQVGRADDMTAKGSGLGLYLVRHIAKMHKGEISVESGGLGQGSVFTLTLPLQATPLPRGE
jgi:signal transduction histidine kinase